LITSALSIGQVIRAPDFSFLDALGALEIMDPKTDSGMIKDDDAESNLADVQSILPEEVIWIMDQLLAREISWHSGNPLAQTLFTCVFLAESLFNVGDTLESVTFIKTPPNKSTFEEELLMTVLRSYILGVVKCCECTRVELQKGNIYEVGSTGVADARKKILRLVLLH
jgi:N-alpha-acetyltransferase 35, NatC auxiliary subunit